MMVPCNFQFFLIMLTAVIIPSVLLLIILIATGSVTIPFLKARLMKRHVVALVKRSGDIDFVTGKYKAGSGTVETKDHGDYYLIPDGIYRTSGSNMSISFEDYGINLPKDFIVASNYLKDKDIQDYRDLKNEEGKK